jgi:NNP family nitrate/nitrite transporter-like MFS transporter
VQAFTYIGYMVIAVSVIVLITRFQKEPATQEQAERNQLAGAV